MTYTRRLFNQFTPSTIRMFVCLSIIAATGVIGLALFAFSHDEAFFLDHPAHALQHPPT
jgi:hypothetical protein